VNKRKKINGVKMVLLKGKKRINYQKVCLWCNKSFGAFRKDKKCCSKECYFKWYHQEHREEEIERCKEFKRKNPNYNKDWHDEHTCLYRKLTQTSYCDICGCNEERSIKLYNERLGVHHKDENKLNNSKDNLICVCKSCHSGIHFTERRKTFGNTRIKR